MFSPRVLGEIIKYKLTKLYNKQYKGMNKNEYLSDVKK